MMWFPPPLFRHYGIYTVGGIHTLCHEERTGNRWPLMEKDANVSEKKEMTENMNCVSTVISSLFVST